MWDFLAHLFDSSGFVPRPAQSGWSAALTWLTGAGDLLLALACLAAPAILLRHAARRIRPAAGLRWPAVALGLAAVSLLLDFYASFEPLYRLCAVTRLLAGLAACAAVASLARAAPRTPTRRAGRARRRTRKALHALKRRLRQAERAR